MILDILGIGTFIHKTIIALVAGVYYLVDYTYQIFIFIAESNIFDNTMYAELVDRIYVVLGVLVLFVIAYNILMMIVDPDAQKSGKAVWDFIKNIIISFILIAVVPTIFEFAMKFQNSLIENNTIQNIFLYDGDSKEEQFISNARDGENSIASAGRDMMVLTFSSFFLADENTKGENSTHDFSEKFQKASGDENAKLECGVITGDSCTLANAKAYARLTGDLGPFRSFAKNITEDEIEFLSLLAIVAGGYLVYCLVSFCFDLAVRVCKLAFYQIIAPLCIITRIIPKKSDVFDKWLKGSLNTYLMVFIRIAVMTLGIYLMNMMHTAIVVAKSNKPEGAIAGVGFFANVFIILGIITFIKQAPKLIEDTFGIVDIKFNIKEKLKESGAFAAGAAIRSGISTTSSGVAHTISNVKQADGTKHKIGAAFRGAGQTISGAVRGTYKGGKAGWNVGSYSEMKDAADKASKSAVDIRNKKEEYRASHHLGKLEGNTPIIGGIAVGANRLADKGKAIARWAGFNNAEEIETKNKEIKEVTDQVDAITSNAKTFLQSKADSGKTWSLGVNGSSSASSLQKANTKVTQDVDYSLENIRILDDAIKTASEKGVAQRVSILNSDKKVKFSAAELERIKGKYMSDYSKAYGDVLLLSDNEYNNRTNSLDYEEVAAMAEHRSDADKTKKTIKRVLGSEVVKEANKAARAKNGQELNAQTIDGNLTFNGDSALDKLVAAGNKIRAENQIKINDIRQQEKDNK